MVSKPRAFSARFFIIISLILLYNLSWNSKLKVLGKYRKEYIKTTA